MDVIYRDEKPGMFLLLGELCIEACIINSVGRRSDIHACNWVGDKMGPTKQSVQGRETRAQTNHAWMTSLCRFVHHEHRRPSIGLKCVSVLDFTLVSITRARGRPKVPVRSTGGKHSLVLRQHPRSFLLPTRHVCLVHPPSASNGTTRIVLGS